MKLSQAISHFSTVTVDGWDQTAGKWIYGVAKGAILTFDRFITERSFGQKKRLFQMAGETGLPSNIDAIRDPYGVRYLVGYMNNDISHEERYNNVYLVQRADYDAELITLTSQVASSGAPTGKQLTVSATFPMDLDKISSSRSSEFEGVYYSGFVASAPMSLGITTDHEIRLNGTLYDIEEVYEAVGIQGMKLNKRSGKL